MRSIRAAFVQQRLKPPRRALQKKRFDACGHEVSSNISSRRSALGGRIAINARIAKESKLRRFECVSEARLSGSLQPKS
jgi:hypothetical protein